MKKVLSIVIVVSVLLSGISASAAVVNGNAKLYQQQFADGVDWYYADYLVDFDGDGNDEHLTVGQEYSSSGKKYNFTVWTGGKKLANSSYYDAINSEYEFVEGVICEKDDGSNRSYLVLKGSSIYNPGACFVYTVVDGNWTQTDKLYMDDFDTIPGGYLPRYYLNERGGELILSSAQVEIETQEYLSDWAKQDIFSAKEAGIIPSVLENPEYRAVITRQQFAALSVTLTEKATGEELASASTDTFYDCRDADVLKAYKAGIVNGVSETEFNPNGVLSREQLATMLWRAISYIQTETKKEVFKQSGGLDGFADADMVSSWAKEAVTALNLNGIMKGTSETELSPKALCSVEQSIALAYRTYQAISGFKASAAEEKSINSAYLRADLYKGKEATAIIADWPEEWKDTIGVSETFENNSYEEVLVVPMENNSLVEIYNMDYRDVGGEYKLVKEECLYSKYSYDGYALLVRSMQYENIPYTMIVVTSPDGTEAEYRLSSCRKERYYDFERFYYIGD